jgi:hypothetical protein
MALPQYEKTPTENLDYTLDWTAWLAAVSDTIDESEWSADSGVTLAANAVSGALTSVYVSGGIIGQTHVVTNTITTSAGRIRTGSIAIRCVAAR